MEQKVPLNGRVVLSFFYRVEDQESSKHFWAFVSCRKKNNWKLKNILLFSWCHNENRSATNICMSYWVLKLDRQSKYIVFYVFWFYVSIPLLPVYQTSNKYTSCTADHVLNSSLFQHLRLGLEPCDRPMTRKEAITLKVNNCESKRLRVIDYNR